MGDIKKPRKIYDTPFKPWDKTRLETERKTMKTYALKNKRELYGAQTTLRKKRRTARELLALPLEQRIKRERELLDSLTRLGLLTKTATLDAVLSLNDEALLERRLQTLVWRKGLANTASQARQFVVHGHVAVNGHRVTAPSYLVPLDEEKTIRYYGKPILIDQPTPQMKKDDLKKQFEEMKSGDAAPADEETPVDTESNEALSEEAAAETDETEASANE